MLFRVAAGREESSVVSDLLNVEAHPRRPQYILGKFTRKTWFVLFKNVLCLASELPLNLFQCDYDGALEWHYDSEAIYVTLKQLQELWTEASVKATMLKTAIDTLKNHSKTETSHSPLNQAECLFGLPKTKNYSC